MPAQKKPIPFQKLLRTKNNDLNVVGAMRSKMVEETAKKTALDAAAAAAAPQEG